MGGIIKRRLMLFAYMFVLLFIMECVIDAILYGRLYVSYWPFEISAVFLFITPILFVRYEKTVVIYSSILFGLFALLMIANLIMDYSSGDIFSLKYVAFTSTVVKVFNFNFINWWYFVMLAGFIAAFVLFMVFVYKKIPYEAHTAKRYQSIGMISALLIIITSFSVRVGQYKDIKSDNANIAKYENYTGAEIVTYTSDILKRSALKKYGLLNYSFGELNSFVVSYKDDVDKYLETDNSYAAKNFYTGKLADMNMNVLEIMIETGVPGAICEELTPNLYNLQNAGIKFNNCYSKNKTNISEFIGINGSTEMPLSTTGYNNSFSLARILKNQGYTTSYFHNNYGEFYGRDAVIPAMGFENAYFFDTMPYYQEGDVWGQNDLFDGNYPLDSDYAEKNLELLVPDKTEKPFYTFWTTLSSHGPFNEGKYNIQYYIDNGYYAKIMEAEESGAWINPILSLDPLTTEHYEEILGQYRNYEAAMMNFDIALGSILERLEETGQIDNTLIVLYGDHEIYYESQGCAPLKNYLYGVSSSVENVNQYETIMIMYNPVLNALYRARNSGNNEYDLFVNPYVIVPTLLDLLGIKYQNKYYVGVSIFNADDDFDNIFYSHELKIIFNDKMLIIDYSAEDDIEYIDESIEEPDEYKADFLNSAQHLVEKIKIFNEMYGTNFFG